MQFFDLFSIFWAQLLNFIFGILQALFNQAITP
jgi:predicted esterase YcpF (UPF0227 family)